MAVDLTKTAESFVGTGISSTYAPEIYANDLRTVLVYVDDMLKTIGDDYVVNGLGSASGINIVAIFPLNSRVYVERNTALKQEVDTQNNETILEDVIDAGFDKSMMIDQEQQGQLNRTVQARKGGRGLLLGQGQTGAVAAIDGDLQLIDASLLGLQFVDFGTNARPGAGSIDFSADASDNADVIDFGD